MTGTPERPPPNRRFERGGEEFGRVLAFSDGMFAIAMTLLVVGIAVPTLSDHESVGALANALGDISDAITSFFISFAVIGRYWVAHHHMFSLLRAFDPGLITINLVYLALIAFLPFPTALLGSYFDNPLAVSVYAATVAVVSALEVALLSHARSHDLLRVEMPEDAYRFGRSSSLTPVVVFAVSVPLAFVSSWLAVGSWALMIPIGIVLNRRAPEGARDYFS